jgi:hypothetical protein
LIWTWGNSVYFTIHVTEGVEWGKDFVKKIVTEFASYGSKKYKLGKTSCFDGKCVKWPNLLNMVHKKGFLEIYPLVSASFIS